MNNYVSIHVSPEDEELLNNETKKFNEQHGLELSRQKFLLKLLKDYARKNGND